MSDLRRPAAQVQELTEASASQAAAQQSLARLQQERQDLLDELNAASGEVQQLREASESATAALASLQQVSL